MKGLAELVQALKSLTEPSALATLVGVKGSSYRKPGARMVFRPGGFQAGSISAGCLETDVKERVTEVVASSLPALVTFDMGNDLDLIWGTGMGCQGRAEVLVERVEAGTIPEWMALCSTMQETRRTGALATVFAARGEGAPPPGTRFLMEGNRELLPMPSELAAPLREALLRVQATGSAETLALGSLEMLVEPLLPPVALWVFGAGEHARPIFRLARELGWYLGLADHRPALATQERFPDADRIVVGHPPESLAGIPLDDRCAALVVSHVYEADKAALTALLASPVGYLGLQGNRRRSERILREITDENGPLTASAQAALHYPAGLDLGAESPELIALSMVSEVQAVLAARPGLSLRDRTGPIH
jgi:xanthine/CO dehydrogenase XdhC/CoxF family maturation factor